MDPHRRAPTKNTSLGMRWYRKILRISYKDHVTNEEVRTKIQQAIGLHENLLTTVKRRKLQWYGSPVHQVWPKPSCKAQSKGGKTGQTEEEVGRQHQGMDRPGFHQVQEDSGEQRKMDETGSEVICGVPTTLVVKGEVKVKVKG